MYNFKICLIMGVFRKRPVGFVSPPSEPLFIRSIENIEETNENDIILRKEVLVPLSPEDYLQKHPPIMEDYTLLEQLQAGVSVKDVATSTLLDSPDNLDYDENEDAEERVLASLEKDVENIEKTE